MATISAKVQQVKDDISKLIDPEVVRRVCQDAGHEWRNRTLDPVTTLKAFALQIAHGNTAMAHVVRLSGGAFTASAYCQARARLPLTVVQAVLADYTARARASTSDDGRWHGHRVALIDGTGVSTPDTPELRQAFGVLNTCAQGCGLPLIKVLSVFGANDGLLLSMHAAPATTGDLKHAHDLHPSLEPGDVVVGDRGLCAYTHLAGLLQIGCHGLFRMASSRAMPFPARRGKRRPLRYNRHRRSEPILVELIGKDDQVVEIVKPHNRPKHMTPEMFASFPAKLIVRALRYTVTGRGVRTDEITLLTTLTDATKYPAAALAELYLMRWRVEVNIRHLKRTLGMDRLKCQTVEGVARELLMFALVYNAVCAVRANTARAMGVSPTRISFIDTLRALLTHAPGPPGTSDVWPDLKVWPLRPPRYYTRRLKRKHSNFIVMNRPRVKHICWVIGSDAVLI